MTTLTHQDIAAAHYRACQRCNVEPPYLLTRLYPQVKRRLSEDETRAMYRGIMSDILAGVMQKDIAAKYNVSPSFIGKVKYGQRGARYTKDLREQWTPPRKLTRDEVRAIFTAAWRGVKHADIAAQYGVCKTFVSEIKRRRKWKSYTRDLRDGAP